jgi:hypothetical protein
MEFGDETSFVSVDGGIGETLEMKCPKDLILHMEE